MTALTRGFFNTRLKQDKPVNSRTRKRLIFVFSHLFAPENRTNSKFGEAAAVNAANEFILLFQEYFFIDLHIWDNTHTSNNHESRSHLLQCLDIVLSAMENESAVSVEGISTLLSNYLEKVNRLNLPQAPEYPSFLGRMPYGRTEHFIGRVSIINSTVQQITHSVPVFLHGIGGIGKTEIAKATLNRIINAPISEHGIRHILWVRYVEGDFARSLVEAFHMDTSTHNIDSLFHEAIEAINQHSDSLLMVIDNVESDSDDRLLQITQYLKCRFLITSRVEGFHQFTRIPIPAMDMDDCMSLFYCYMNIPDEAIRYYREAIRIDELTYGPDHEATAYIHNNVGAVYSENGKPEKAIPEHLHALRVYQAAHPDRMNLDLAQTHCDLADAYLRLGDLDQCTEHLNEAFPIYEAMLPENAHQLLPPYSTLANLLVEANDFIQAETIYGHILWLLLQNGYQEESPSVQEFAAKLEEVKVLADRQRKNSKS